VPVFRAGRLIYENPHIEEIRERLRHQLDCFHPGIKRFVNPHQYPAGLELGLHERKTRLVLEARGEDEGRRPKVEGRKKAEVRNPKQKPPS
jgi:nicotinate phosphoribosyltransferase